MILEIPIPTSSFSSITVDLDEVTYMLVFRWNTRETSWYMDLCEVDGTVIAGGIKIVANVDLTSRFHAQGSPKGALITIGESIKDDRPGRDEFGTRVKLYYFDEAEMIAGAAA